MTVIGDLTVHRNCTIYIGFTVSVRRVMVPVIVMLMVPVTYDTYPTVPVRYLTNIVAYIPVHT